MAKKKLSHEAGGEVFTRTTANDYTHVVVVHLPEGNIYPAPEGGVERLVVWSWHGSRSSAEKAARAKPCRYWKPAVEAINDKR